MLKTDSFTNLKATWSPWVSPHLLISIYLFWLLLRPYPAYHFGRLGTRLADLAVIVVLIAFYFLLTERRGFKIKISPVSWLFGLLFLHMIFSLAYSRFVLDLNIIFRDFFEFYRVPYYLLVLNFAYQIEWDNEKLESYLFRPLLWSGAIVVAFGVAQKFNIFDINYIITPLYRDESKIAGLLYREFPSRRIISTLYNPNQYALFLIWFVMFLLNMFFLKRNKWFLFATLPIFISIWWTSSRTGLLTLGVVLLFFAMQLVRYGMLSKSKAILGILVACTAIFALLQYLMATSENRYMLEMLYYIEQGRFFEVNSLRLRLNIWEIQMQYIWQSPIMGWGPSKDEIGNVTDNQYLFVLRRYGVIGLGLFLLIFGRLYYMTKHALTYIPTITAERTILLTFLCMWITLMFANLTGEFSDAIQLVGIFYLIAGVCCRIYTDKRIALYQAAQSSLLKTPHVQKNRPSDLSPRPH